MVQGFVFNKSANASFDQIEELPAWSVNLFIAISIVVMVLAVTGNSIILIVEQFNRQKSSTDWFVTLMSFNDLIVAALVVPVYILSYSDIWPRIGSDLLCGVSNYIQESLSYSSVLVLTVTALDRYIKTCRPYSTGITPKRAMHICAGVIMFTSTLTIGLFFIAQYDDVHKCVFIITGRIAKSVVRGLVIFINASFIVMFIVVLFSYSMVGYAIRKRIKTSTSHGKNGQISSTSQENTQRNGTKFTFISKLFSRKNQVEPLPQTSDGDHGNHGNDDISVIQIAKEETKRPAKTTNIAEHLRILKEKNMNRTSVIMLAVTLVFILSWIPPWAVSVLWSEGLGYNVNSRIIQMFWRRSFIINTCTNPLFYIGMSSEFRKLTRRTFTKLCARL